MAKLRSSPSGNRTLVSRVTGGDTDHYTNEDCMFIIVKIMIQTFTHMRNCPRATKMSTMGIFSIPRSSDMTLLVAQHAVVKV